MSKRILWGVVVSDKGDKSIVVRVERRVRHPVYQKIIRRSSKVMAHDPENRCKEGDLVRIQLCRPLSMNKRWELLADGALVGGPSKGLEK